jgi:hypothetical protein
MSTKDMEEQGLMGTSHEALRFELLASIARAVASSQCDVSKAAALERAIDDVLGGRRYGTDSFGSGVFGKEGVD